MHTYNREARKLLPLCFWALSLWQLGLITLIHMLASFFLEFTPPTREGQTHYSLPQPLLLGTPALERSRPSICLNGKESSDTFPEALVLEIPAFQFQCAECRSSTTGSILAAIEPLSSCSFKCGFWTNGISITQELVRNANYGAPLQTYYIWISSLPSSPYIKVWATWDHQRSFQF